MVQCGLTDKCRRHEWYHRDCLTAAEQNRAEQSETLTCIQSSEGLCGGKELTVLMSVIVKTHLHFVVFHSKKQFVHRKNPGSIHVKTIIAFVTFQKGDEV